MTYDPNVTKTEVRGGNSRRMNLRVLVISVVIIVVAFAAIWIYFASQTPPSAVP